jgi:DNA topoisomerase-1
VDLPLRVGAPRGRGTDAAGRRQYRYNDRWRERRDQEKFDRVERFAGALPRLPKVVARDIAGDGMTRERLLACAVRLLDRAFFRMGSESYADEHGTVGIATIGKKTSPSGATPSCSTTRRRAARRSRRSSRTPTFSRSSAC